MRKKRTAGVYIYVRNEKGERKVIKMKNTMSCEMLSEQYLLNKNQIYIFGVIETGMAARIIPQMHYIEQKMIDENIPKEERILTILINSPGGSVSDGLAIYDTINSLECEVRTYKNDSRSGPAHIGQDRDRI